MGLAWLLRPLALRTSTVSSAGARGPAGAAVTVVVELSVGAAGVPTTGGRPPAAASVLASLHWRRTMPMASATAMRPVPRAKAPRKERVNEAPAAAGRRRAASGPPGAERSVTGTRTRRTAGRSGPAGDGRGGGGGA